MSTIKLLWKFNSGWTIRNGTVIKSCAKGATKGAILSFSKNILYVTTPVGSTSKKHFEAILGTTGRFMTTYKDVGKKRQKPILAKNNFSVQYNPPYQALC